MFDQISDRFNSLLRDLRGLGKITDKNIRVMGRATQGVKLIRLSEGDEISSVAKIETIKEEKEEE